MEPGHYGLNGVNVPEHVKVVNVSEPEVVMIQYLHVLEANVQEIIQRWNRVTMMWHVRRSSELSLALNSVYISFPYSNKCSMECSVDFKMLFNHQVHCSFKIKHCTLFVFHICFIMFFIIIYVWI